MNRFKSKKKGGKDLDLSEPRPSLESESSFSLFRRGKKNPELETKKDIDLSEVLPSNDDFRTSLLMSGLSARFSMLREQDDPSSKIGKASDDSVLFPKRQSRLADFGFANGKGLGDIAEVESLRAPQFLRKDSVGSTDSGGVMTRSRPMESNILFGGRQKIYKIAAGSPAIKSTGDGMSGRALYDDDVSMSAFQKWRQAEREREAGMMYGDHDDNDKATNDEARGVEDTSFISRSESPLLQGYNKKRETSSTTSSAPSGGRNSTAATSVVSQPISASKDNHAQQTAASSAAPTTALERHVTRTRRLYEQGLTQDLQEQQHSVLSRVDTLTRQPRGGRTPEMTPITPSPTAQAFVDRWAAYGGERRTILSKGSAPNLRSISTTATKPMNDTMTLDTGVSNGADAKSGPFTSPPLSPPISDGGTGEQVSLHIQPRDVGKATAMNMFQKPNSTYDDMKYAERQRQLQLGRETPAQGFQDDANFPSPDLRFQSVSAPRQDSDIKTTTLSVPKQADGSGKQDSGVTFLEETVESPILNEHVFQPPASPEVRLERPSDQDHPAFRNPTTLTASAFASKVNEQQQPANTNFLTVAPPAAILADSPTLGPNVGLSGMVRQHMRTESDVSSIYAPQNDTQSPERRDDPPRPTQPWEEQILADAHGNQQMLPPTSKPPMPPVKEAETSRNSPGTSLGSPRSPDEEDEFASQLANARRRVREKLTSFVETDGSSFSPPATTAPMGELPPTPSRPNALGILKAKSSRGSLIDRSREAAPRTIKEHGGGFDTEARLNEEEDAHPSLRAFRQVRREVQRRQETETMARQPMGPTPLAGGTQRETTRTIGTEYQNIGPRRLRQMREGSPKDVPQPPPRSETRVAGERSESENSDESNRSRSRPPPRSGDRAGPREGQLMPSEIVGGPGSRSPLMHSPGLPGTDVRRSPYMPPVGTSQNGYPSSNMRNLPGRSMTGPMPSKSFSPSTQTGRFEPPRVPSQPNSAPGSAPLTPTGLPTRRPSVPSQPHPSGNGSTLTDSMKRVVNKNDISEPTFLMSTSRVPTTNLPPSAPETRGNRTRGESVTEPNTPPPLPPVNPRRKRDNAHTRATMGGLLGGRKGDETANGAFSASTPQLPLVPPPAAPFAQEPEGDRHSAFSITDEEDGKPHRRRLRKATSEMKMDVQAGSAGLKRVSPPQVAVGPPAGRAVVVGMRGGPSPHLPGGMF